MGHGKQPLCQLCVQQLRGNPHFPGNSKEPPEERVDAALVYDAEWGEEGPVQGDVSLRYGLEVLVQPVQYGVDECVTKAERGSGESTEDAGINIGVVTSVWTHHLHACLTEDLGNQKRNLTLFLPVIIFMTAIMVTLLLTKKHQALFR